MPQNIILKSSPRIEVRIDKNGFELLDARHEEQSGYYAYTELEAVELKRPWYPRLTEILRAMTTIFNGAPFFPDADSYKKSTLVIRAKNSKLGIWLADADMVDKAKSLKNVLIERGQLGHD